MSRAVTVRGNNPNPSEREASLPAAAAAPLLGNITATYCHTTTPQNKFTRNSCCCDCYTVLHAVPVSRLRCMLRLCYVGLSSSFNGLGLTGEDFDKPPPPSLGAGWSLSGGATRRSTPWLFQAVAGLGGHLVKSL